MENLNIYGDFFSLGLCVIKLLTLKVSKGAKIRNRYNQVPHLTPVPGYQWESDKLTADTTNESQEVSPFPAGDHKAHTNTPRHSKHKTEQKHKRSTKEVPPWNGQ